MALNRIFIVEDDMQLASQAYNSLASAGYEPIRIDLKYANDISEWSGQQIQHTDLVILDLNFKLIGVNYSGKDILRLLEQGKKTNVLVGLEQILIATSMRGEVDPRQVSPEIAFIDERIAMYGLEKGVNQLTRAVDPQTYGQSVLQAVNEIYRGTRTVLNR